MYQTLYFITTYIHATVVILKIRLLLVSKIFPRNLKRVRVLASHSSVATVQDIYIQSQFAKHETCLPTNKGNHFGTLLKSTMHKMFFYRKHDANNIGKRIVELKAK